jgi:hypothetical protein
LNLHLAVLILQRGYHLVNELPGVFRVILKLSFEKLNRAGYRAAMMTEKRRFRPELVAQSEDVTRPSVAGNKLRSKREVATTAKS